MRIWYHCQFGAVGCTSDLVLVGSSKGFERDFFFHNRTKLRALRKIDLKWQIIPLVKYRKKLFSECANTLAIACLSLGWWLSKCSYTADWPHPLFKPAVSPMINVNRGVIMFRIKKQWYVSYVFVKSAFVKTFYTKVSFLAQWTQSS